MVNIGEVKFLSHCTTKTHSVNKLLFFAGSQRRFLYIGLFAKFSRCNENWLTALQTCKLIYNPLPIPSHWEMGSNEEGSNSCVFRVWKEIAKNWISCSLRYLIFLICRWLSYKTSYIKWQIITRTYINKWVNNKRINISNRPLFYNIIELNEYGEFHIKNQCVDKEMMLIYLISAFLWLHQILSASWILTVGGEYDM